MIKKLNLGILFFFIGYLSPAVGHPTHVSLLTFHYNYETNSMEVTMRLFTDDLEKALENSRVGSLKLGSKNENSAADSLIFDYFREKIVLTFDSSNIYFQWVGKEVEYDVTWCYLEIMNIKPFHFVSLENSIFFEEFEDQLNIVHFIKNGKVKSLMLHQGNPSGQLTFNK